MSALLMLVLALGQADDDAADEAVKVFKVAYGTPDEAGRASAVTTLAGTVHKKTLGVLGSLLARDVKPVRLAAAKGLAGFKELARRAVPALARGLAANAKEPEVQVAILETLGTLADPSALSAVHRELDARDGRVAAAAFKAAGLIGDARSIDPILKELKTLEQQAKQSGGGLQSQVGGQNYNLPSDDSARKRAQTALPAANNALKAITRQNYGTHAEWSGWWRRNRATFKTSR